jgi:hypothetical protein
MSAPSIPPDNSAQIREMELQEQRDREIREQREAEKRKQELAALRGTASSAARDSALSYFTGRGVQTDEYIDDVDRTINSILSGIAPDDPNPGSYFKDIGPRVFDEAQTGFRTKAASDIDRLLPSNFEMQRIGMDLDDPYLAGIEGEEFQEADSIIQNRLMRGVLNNTGASAARKNLEDQRPSVKSRLNEIGTGLLSTGQQKLRDIANEGRQTAATVNLGQQFDPFSYGKRVDQTFTDFLNNLGNELRARVTGDLFHTAGLPAIGGAAQGAGNFKFDPSAFNPLGGSNPDEDDDDEDENQNDDSIF